MSAEQTLAEVKLVVANIFAEMDELGATVHPMVVGEFMRLADLLGIPENDVPTESSEWLKENK